MERCCGRSAQSFQPTSDLSLSVWWSGRCLDGTPRLAQAASQPALTSVTTWIGRSAQIEAHLKTAAITRIEDIGTGVTRPRRAHLEPSDPVESLVWKVLPPGRRRGYWESYKSEIAAYELDKLLAMNTVPPVVERTIEGETGAAVMWIAGTRSVKDMGGKVPSGPTWDKPIRRMTMFDNLIANIDRNAGNILVGRPGELILIDHSRVHPDRSSYGKSSVWMPNSGRA